MTRHKYHQSQKPASTGFCRRMKLGTFELLPSSLVSSHHEILDHDICTCDSGRECPWSTSPSISAMWRLMGKRFRSFFERNNIAKFGYQNDKSWSGVCVANENVDYKRPFLKNGACTKSKNSSIDFKQRGDCAIYAMLTLASNADVPSNWCSVANIPCTGSDNPQFQGLCFNTGSECTGKIYFYETGKYVYSLCMISFRRLIRWFQR